MSKEMNITSNKLFEIINSNPTSFEDTRIFKALLMDCYPEIENKKHINAFSIIQSNNLLHRNRALTKDEEKYIYNELLNTYGLNKEFIADCINIWNDLLNLIKKSCKVNFNNIDSIEDSNLNILRSKAKHNDKYAQQELARTLLYANYSDSNNQLEAIYWLRLSVENGNIDAYTDLGDCYYFGLGTDVDYSKAIKCYKEAADFGNLTAAFDLACCYYDGIGIGKDYGEAVRLYEFAANNNHSDAQYSLGLCYHLGKGVNKDETRAIDLIIKSARQDNPRALLDMAYRFLKADGVPKNEKQSFAYAEKASMMGFIPSYGLMGYLFFHGIGTQIDINIGMDWWKKGADNNEPYSQCYYGICLLEGKHIKQDIKIGEELLSIAENKVDKDLYDRIQIIKLLYLQE